MEPEFSIDKFGSQHWLLNGKLHRVDGPAIIHPSGIKIWYLNGKPHRVGGPAEVWSDGYQVWFLNGQRHREDGPAIVHPDGPVEYWAYDIEYDSLEELIIGVMIDG